MAESTSSARLWAGVLVGAIVGLPMAWILSYAAALPFFIGLFFFALLGLIIGAVAFRVGAACRPYATWQVLLGTAIVICVVWSGSLYKESRDFPTDMAEIAARRTRDIGDRSAEEFQQATLLDVRRYLREEHAPGGFVGYVRWIVSSGQIPRGELALVPRTLTRPQHGTTWVIRVLLSLGLLGFGVGSQMWPLASRANKGAQGASEPAR